MKNKQYIEIEKRQPFYLLLATIMGVMTLLSFYFFLKLFLLNFRLSIFLYFNTWVLIFIVGYWLMRFYVDTEKVKLEVKNEV